MPRASAAKYCIGLRAPRVERDRAEGAPTVRTGVRAVCAPLLGVERGAEKKPSDSARVTSIGAALEGSKCRIQRSSASTRDVTR